MRGKEKQESAEIRKEINESQQDIEKMLKEMEGYEQIFTDAAQWLREKIEKAPVFAYQLPDDDEVMIKALKIVVIKRNASTSYLQRKLKISYNRAAELLETMEARGIVGPLADNGKREILVDIPQKEAENQSE
jgi:DNA segregation ATPase FtsK/SpoIIIE-like protein